LVLTEGNVGFGGTQYSGFYTSQIDAIDRGDLERWSVSAQMDRRIGNVKFVSISAYQWNDADFYNDIDGTPLFLLDAERYSVEDAFTQELQLLSDTESKLQWIIGAFYLTSTAESNPSRLLGGAIAPLTFLDRVGVQDTR